MLRSAMLAAPGAAAAGMTDAKRLVGHRSAPIDDRSPMTQSSSVHNNLIIFCGATTEAAGPMQLAAAGKQAHAGSRRLHGVARNRRRFSTGNIVRDDWQQHCQQLCHRLEEALFRAAALAIRCNAMLHLGHVQKIGGPPIWSRRSSDTGPTPPERHYQSCMPQ